MTRLCTQYLRHSGRHAAPRFVATLLNGIACGTLSIAIIQVAHALPERWAWAARLKTQDVGHPYAAMDSQWGRVTKPITDWLTAPLERLCTLPDMGL